MRLAGRLKKVWQSSVQAGVAGVLCVLMIEQPLLAGATVVKRGPTAGGPQVLGNARIVHALNRLTFGPKPGDVAAVKAMGLNAWIEAQLNPAKIDDSALEARLAQFPAMQLPQSELIARYPTQQIIRQMEQTNAWLPADPVEHAIYADEMAFYRIQKEKQDAAKAAAPAAGPDSMAGDSMAPAAAVGGKKAARRAAQNGDAAGGDMASGAPPAGSIAADGAAAGAMAPSASEAALLKSEMDPNAAPTQHVEELYKDLEAVNIINLPPQERMRKVLALRAPDFVAFRQSLSGPELTQFAEGLSPEQREIFAAMQNSTRMVSSEALQSRLIRDIYSDRQLEAVMTDFWLNHFNVYIRKNQNEPYLIPAYEREVIRPNALGKFEDLLVATAKSPAMLEYLDNAQSVGPNSPAAKMGRGFPGRFQNPQARAQLKDRGLNENYGRELMELHTLGVNGGYTQADVTQVSKVFTGWAIGQPRQGGTFEFDERRHEPGSKTVLGQTVKENGMNEGLQVLHMLATSAATAKFISTKLAVRFVSDTPPPALVDRMSKAFLDSDGDIKTVLRTMFASPEFWAPSAERAKVKTPLEFVVSAVRASGATVNNAQGLVQALDRLGMPLYGMQTPNGYSWMSEPWVSTGALVSRMNFALVMTGDKLPGTRTDWSKLLAGPAVTAKPVSMGSDTDPEVAAKEAKLEQVLLGQPVSDRTRAAVIAQSGDTTAAIQAAKEFQGAGGRFGGGAAAGLIGGEYNPVIPGAGAARPGAEGAFALRNAVPDDRQAAIMAGLLLGSPEFQRR